MISLLCVWQDENTRIIRELREEIARLRESLNRGGGIGPSHDEVLRMEVKCDVTSFFSNG